MIDNHGNLTTNQILLPTAENHLLDTGNYAQLEVNNVVLFISGFRIDSELWRACFNQHFQIRSNLPKICTGNIFIFVFVCDVVAKNSFSWHSISFCFLLVSFSTFSWKATFSKVSLKVASVALGDENDENISVCVTSVHSRRDACQVIEGNLWRKLLVSKSGIICLKRKYWLWLLLNAATVQTRPL